MSAPKIPQFETAATLQEAMMLLAQWAEAFTKYVEQEV